MERSGISRGAPTFLGPPTPLSSHQGKWVPSTWRVSGRGYDADDFITLRGGSWGISDLRPNPQ